jgi:uncharacterized phage protein (TIGR01671 family)
MRNPKFRVWDKLDQRMICPDVGYQGHYALSLDGHFHNLQNGSGGKEYIIQQYTGKKDVEGKEIYEGDFVELVFALQTHPVTGERNGPADSFGVYWVYYSEESAAFKLKVIKNNWFGFAFVTKEEAAKRTINPECPVTPVLEDELKNYKVCRVIGNIFENPELLKTNERTKI